MAEAKKAKPQKPATERLWVPKEKLTGGYILGKVGKVGLRSGAYLGAAWLSNRPKVAASKFRPYMPAVGGLVGLAGEIFLNPDNMLTDTLKGVAEGLTTYAIVDGVTQLFPDQASNFSLTPAASLGAVREVEVGGGMNWAALAEQIADEERRNGARIGPRADDMAGLAGRSSDDDEDDDPFVRHMAA